MTSRVLALVGALGAALGGPAAHAEVQGAPPSTVESSAKLLGTEDRSESHGRIDLSHTLSDDDATVRHLSFTDLRVTAEAARLGGELSFRLDGRARKSWNELAGDRLSATELLLRYGEGGPWVLTAGRQLQRGLASAPVDGLTLQRRLVEGTEGRVFLGFLPHPLSGEWNTDFTTAGLGYERGTPASQHSGGGVVSLYRGSIDRLYLTQSSHLSVGPRLMFSGFAVADLFPPRPDGGAATPGFDLTNLNALARYRPARWLTSSLSLSHHHTLLPGTYWRDWLAEQRRLRGFSIDGEEPVGTRVTSARWTNSFDLGPATSPYLRLRLDRRHTEVANGFEGQLGFKWRPRQGFADLHYAYRSFFAAQSHLAAASGGVDWPGRGAEIGLTALRSQPFGQSAWSTSYDLYANAWVAFGSPRNSPGEVRLAAQYQAFLQHGSLLHLVSAQLGYHF